MSKTPKLRFKEFSGDWESKRLGNCVEINSGGSPTDILDENGTIPYFKVEQLNNSSKYQVDTPYRISNSKKIITSGSIIFPKRGAAIMLNKIRILAQDSFMDTNLMTLTVKKSSINNEFLYTYLLKENLSKLADTTSIPQINNKHIEPYEINIPSKEEQEKIASFFSLIDDKISLQGEKVEALKDYKKGIMQKIFSRELRFKDDDGRDYPEWISCKVGDCFSERSERGFEDLELLSVSMQNGVIRRSDIEGKDNSSENKSNYKLVKVDDIVYNSMRMWQGASGLSKFEGIVSPAYTILIPKNNVCSKYFAYLFKMEKIIYEFRKYSQGLTSDTWNLKYPQIKDIKVKLPSYDEQVKISNFIENIDNKIRKEQDKLDSLNGYKKGLLQQMFI